MDLILNKYYVVNSLQGKLVRKSSSNPKNTCHLLKKLAV